jgi:hypothetical protein
MFRPESLVALQGVDSVLHSLEQVAAVAPRRYRLVVVSDHGQSQGATFEDRYGLDLAGLCSSLTSESVGSIQEPVESLGRAGSLFDDMSSKDHRSAAGSAARRVRREVEESAPEPAGEALVVLGSGNLGLVYVPGKVRLTREEIDRRWPSLIPGLTAHPGVGFVAVMSERGAQAIGSSGLHWLDESRVEGDDPMAPFAAHAAENLRRAVNMDRAPDLYVNSAVDDGTLEVAAFEPLVGSHGGLGGWQDSAVLLIPSDLRPTRDPIHGADELHRVLVGVLRSLGHRAELDVPAVGNPSHDPSDVKE